MKNKLILIFAGVFALVMIFSVYRLISIGRATTRSETAFDKLRADLESADEKTAAESRNGETDTESVLLPAEPVIIPEYETLYAGNADFVGWIKIADTRIDYPVMQTKDDPEYYLRKAYDGTYDIHGTPFLDSRCDLRAADNYIIYGHHMRDGTMFADLMKFTDADFCRSDPEIRFDTLYERGVWHVVTVFKISADAVDVFPYNRFSDFSSGEYSAADYIARCRPYAIWYDDSVDTEGKKLLTLSTCDYTYENGRLVVVAVSD